MQRKKVDSFLEYYIKNHGKLWYMAICFLLVVFALSTVLHFYTKYRAVPKINFERNNAEGRLCSIQIVESIPVGLNYSEDSPQFLTTYDAWQILLNHTEKGLNIASFYWTMRGVDVVNHTTADEGEKIYEDIKAMGVLESIKIRIVQNVATDVSANLDTDLLQKLGAADVRSINFTRLLGGGVLHTKLWISDNKHFYLGSANMDWRSLTQVKELGVLGFNCPILSEDFNKIFEAYWYLGGKDSSIPRLWPIKYSTKYNFYNPIILSSTNDQAVISSSPPPLTAKGRVNDLDSIVNTILQAKSFVYIAVMDYYPLLMFTQPQKYWPLIDDAIRKAAIENKASIRLLISWWRYSNNFEDNFLKSLNALSESFDGINIEVRRFIVPINDDQLKIPYSRVNHNKYMVTDNAAYIGTSNWSGDYFTDTAGIGLHIQNPANSSNNLQRDLLSIFERDWNSPYAVVM